MAQERTIDFERYAGAVADKLLGERNKALSKGRVRKYGTNGSLSFNEDGGRFYDHEAQKGGGVLWLIEQRTGLRGGDAIEWLRTEVGADIPDERKPNGHYVNGAPAPQARQASPSRNREEGRREEVKTYDYTDPQGSLVYQVVRFQWRLSDGSWRSRNGETPDKTFLQRRPGEDGKWVWDLKGIGHSLLYRNVELREAIDAGYTVFVPEGEKDVDNLIAQELPATTNSGGAKNWSDVHADQLAGADVVVLVDNDDAGRDRGDTIARSLNGKAKRVRVVDLSAWAALPSKGDVSDWISRGGTADRLMEIADETQDWRPEPFQSKLGLIWFKDIGAKKPERDWLAKRQELPDD
jgi:hypothetical protein